MIKFGLLTYIYDKKHGRKAIVTNAQEKQAVHVHDAFLVVVEA
jgi:hypothetical protein